MAGGRSRFDETGKKHLRKGVTLYKRGASPFWYARIWNNSERQYLVRSTKETSRLEAAEVAEEIYADLKVKGSLQGTLNFVPVPGQWGTLPLSMKGGPNETTSKNIY